MVKANSVVISESANVVSGGAPAEDLLGAWGGSGDLCYCRDEGGRILAANLALARKLGQALDLLRGRAAAEFVHPEDPAPPPESAAVRLEQRWLTPQGWRWITWDETVLRQPGGTFLGVRAVGHDTTRQRLAEEQFFKLSRAFDQAPVAMVITDMRGRVQYVNARFTHTTGRTLEQILEENMDVLREGHPDGASYEQFWETVRAGREWRGELMRPGTAGKPVWESVQVSALRNAAGEITNLLCLREDITDRKLLEDQLRQAQKLEGLGTLAGGIAHDFNNLLAIISGYAELTLHCPAETAVVQRNTREIRRAAQRAIGLVRQILTFSRKAEVRFSALDLNQLVRELAALLGETFPRNIALNLALLPNLPHLLADQNQIQQIVLNLCVNARDAMPAGGTISISTCIVPGSAVPSGVPHSRACACLQVTDTGTGMPPEVRARIFEPFFTTKQVNEGTGLGLAVVYGIVASHDGFIDVESTPGNGSSFRVYLPLADGPATNLPAPAAGEFPRGTERILVVDDEDPLRRLLETALTAKGYHVTGAMDGLEAITLLCDLQREFDLVLLDLNMPGATGLEVLRVIRSVRPATRVLIVTGHLGSDMRTELEKLGQQEFLRKPYSLDELGRQLRTILEAE